MGGRENELEGACVRREGWGVSALFEGASSGWLWVFVSVISFVSNETVFSVVAPPPPHPALFRQLSHAYLCRALARGMWSSAWVRGARDGWSWMNGARA